MKGKICDITYVLNIKRSLLSQSEQQYNPK